LPNELDYDCLQVLVKMYSLQELYMNEQQKVLAYFVHGEHNKLLRELRIVQQFKAKLLDAIIEEQREIENCI